MGAKCDYKTISFGSADCTRVYWTVPIQSALGSNDPDASDGGSNFEIRPLGVDLAGFEVATLPQIPGSFNRDEVSPKWLNFKV